jgi:serine/threonine-protein kinase
MTEFGRFRFDVAADRLGEGPQSEVFRATDTRLNRVVALKILRPNVEIDPEALLRFQREAQHTSQLSHPNIATVYDYGTEDSSAYIAMEYLEGLTLDKILKNQPLSFEEGLRVAQQVASALALVHSKGMIHRDLKPGNIMVLEDGSVKLLDFGIARLRTESTITQSGLLVGTVLYMSPEQVRGEELDARSDVFSFGSVFYHALTGQLPFPGRSFPEVCMAILDCQPRRPSDVRQGFPRPLEEFLLACLQREKEKRFADGQAAYGGLLATAEALRLATDERAAPSFRGRVIIPPFALERESAGADRARSFALSLRRDVAAELARSTQVDVRAVEDGELGKNTRDDALVLKATLALSARTGRLACQLERAPRANGAVDGAHRLAWSAEFEHSDADEWSLQAKLASALVRGLKRKFAELALAPGEARSREPERARQLILRAHDVMMRGTSKHLIAAISAFRQAIDADPTVALAYAGLAEGLVRKFLYWDGDKSFLDEAFQQARRALALDPRCAEGHTSLGFAYSMGGQQSDAQREYKVAIQLNNDEWFAHRLLGALLAREGNTKAAASYLRRSTLLKPEHIGSYDHLHCALKRLDRYEEALTAAEDGIAAARKHLTAVRDDNDARLHLALLLARIGDEAAARAEVQRARELAPRDGFTLFHAASCLALLGDAPAAMEALQEAAARGYFVRSELQRNADFESLRGSPEFQALLG